jgi:hypothetical protein
MQGMMEEKQKNPDLLIPSRFSELYNKTEMLELIKSIY